MPQERTDVYKGWTTPEMREIVLASPLIAKIRIGEEIERLQEAMFNFEMLARDVCGNMRVRGAVAVSVTGQIDKARQLIRDAWDDLTRELDEMERQGA